MEMGMGFGLNDTAASGETAAGGGRRRSHGSGQTSRRLNGDSARGSLHPDARLRPGLGSLADEDETSHWQVLAGTELDRSCESECFKEEVLRVLQGGGGGPASASRLGPVEVVEVEVEGGGSGGVKLLECQGLSRLECQGLSRLQSAVWGVWTGLYSKLRPLPMSVPSHCFPAPVPSYLLPTSNRNGHGPPCDNGRHLKYLGTNHNRYQCHLSQ